MTPDPDHLVEIYIDERSQNRHRYLVLGGIMVTLRDSDSLSAAIIEAREPELPQGEAKWTKVSRGKLPAYKRIVDVIFDYSDNLHFHSLCVDTTRVDHARFNASNREIGFNKEIYQLARKFWRLYPRYFFHVYPDCRKTTQQPEDLRDILNRGCRDKRDRPFRRCQFRDSKTTLPLQLTDILVGSIAYCLNGHDTRDDASPAKCELSSHVLERAGIADAFRDTTPAATFTIWHRRLR